MMSRRSTEFTRRRDMLLRLFYINAPETVSTLVRHTTIVPPRHISLYLEQYPNYRFLYLMQCWRTDELTRISLSEFVNDLCAYLLAVRAVCMRTCAGTRC